MRRAQRNDLTVSHAEPQARRHLLPTRNDARSDEEVQIARSYLRWSEVVTGTPPHRPEVGPDNPTFAGRRDVVTHLRRLIRNTVAV